MHTTALSAVCLTNMHRLSPNSPLGPDHLNHGSLTLLVLPAVPAVTLSLSTNLLIPLLTIWSSRASVINIIRQYLQPRKPTMLSWSSLLQTVLAVNGAPLIISSIASQLVRCLHLYLFLLLLTGLLLTSWIRFPSCASTSQAMLLSLHIILHLLHHLWISAPFLLQQ